MQHKVFLALVFPNLKARSQKEKIKIERKSPIIGIVPNKMHHYLNEINVYTKPIYILNSILK